MGVGEGVRVKEREGGNGRWGSTEGFNERQFGEMGEELGLGFLVNGICRKLQAAVAMDSSHSYLDRRLPPQSAFFVISIHIGLRRKKKNYISRSPEDKKKHIGIISISD